MVAVGEKVFGKYEVLRRLAAGGMGEIFLSRQTGVVDRLVILKSLLPQLAKDDQALASFLDEARILASISHPNVCALYDVGEWTDTHFIAMEFINGADVSQLLKVSEEQRRRVPPLVSAHIVREAAMGLDAAHVATDATGTPLRVVHRDISPHNLMVRADGLTKVVDFGVASAENRQQKTEAGLLKGKLGYMAPEQIKGAPVEPKADQFSLGVLLWEMLTQRRLFVGENAPQVFMRILREKAPAPSTVVSDVPPELDAIVLRMTAQEPVDRYPRLGDAAMALRRVLEQYKSPDNAVAQFVRQTVGPELQTRLKELATRPSTTTAATAGTPSPSSVLPKVVCGSCGTACPAGDRFCRSCGSPLTSQPRAEGGTPTSTPSPTPAQLPPRSGQTGAMPRLDVLGGGTGALRREGLSSAFLKPPAGGTPVGGTQAPTPGELAVIAGLVEAQRAGVSGPADADQRRAAFGVVDDIAARHGAHNAVVQKSQDSGRFAVIVSGAGAIAAAVAFARQNTALAARAGPEILLRLGVAADEAALGVDTARVRATADVLVDNAVPGTTVITDVARKRGGLPPVARSATVPLREGNTLAHELVIARRLPGRATEIAAIDALFDDVLRPASAAEKRTTQLMLLGDGGIGKSALIEVGVGLAKDRGFVVGRAHGAQVRSPPALSVLRQLIKSVSIDVLLGEGQLGSGATSWSRALEFVGVPAAYARRVRALVDDDGDGDDVPATRRRAVMKAAVITFFEKLCERGPVLLAVDDQHAGDAISFEFLAELGARMSDRRLVVLVAGRPVQGERVLPLAKRVIVPPLGTDDVVAMAVQLLGGKLPDQLQAFLIARALGNPLVVRLLLRHLIALRALTPSAAGPEVQGDLYKLALPTNPTALIHANHALFPPPAQQLLTALAQLGVVVDVGFIARCGIGGADGAAHLRGLCEAGVLDVMSVGERAAWRGEAGEADLLVFRSLVEWETAAGRADAALVRPVHERAAAVLADELRARFTLPTAERLVKHLVALGQKDAIVDVSAQAGARAMTLGLFDVATEHHKRVLAGEWRALTPGPDAEARAERVLRVAAQACRCMIEVDAAAAVDVVAPVLKSAPPLLATNARVEALRQRGLALARLKRFSEAENCLDEALETLAMSPDTALQAGLLTDIATVLEQRGDVDSAITQLQEALRLFGEGGDRTRAFEALLLVGRLALRQREFLASREALGQTIREAAQLGKRAVEADARGILGALHLAEGNSADAERETQAAVALAVDVGDPVLESRLRTQLGRLLVTQGRRADAAQSLGLAVELARRGQWDEGVGAAQQLLAVVGNAS